MTSRCTIQIEGYLKLHIWQGCMYADRTHMLMDCMPCNAACMYRQVQATSNIAKGVHPYQNAQLGP